MTYFYSKSHPTPDDVLLLIEVAESSLRYAREVKLALYARHGIPAVWLVDLNGKQLILFSRPTESGYQTIETADVSRPVALPCLAEVQVDLAGLF